MAEGMEPSIPSAMVHTCTIHLHLVRCLDERTAYKSRRRLRLLRGRKYSFSAMVRILQHSLLRTAAHIRAYLRVLSKISS